MKEGFWINYVTGDIFHIDEHERWLRRDGNADRLGIPEEVVNSFGRFEPGKDRKEFLTFVMRHTPVVRVRGHGLSITFEFADSDTRRPLEAVKRWCLRSGVHGTAESRVNAKRTIQHKEGY